MRVMAQNYLIVGNDEYLKGREVARIKADQQSSKDEKADCTSFSGGEIESIMADAGTMPFLSPKRVIVVNDISELDQNGAKTLLSYLKNPSESTVLIMTAPGSYKKKKDFKKLKEFTDVINVQTPKGYHLEKRIRSYFKKHSLAISSGAVKLMVELKGEDSAAVKNASDKLISYSNGKTIETGDVDKLIGRSVTESVFKLVDALDIKDKKRAFNVLRDLYAEGKRSYEIIGTLVWHLRIMKRIVFLEMKGKSENFIAKDLGYSRGYVRRLMGKARKYTPERISLWQNALLEADLNSKTGTSQEVAMDMLLIKLISL